MIFLSKNLCLNRFFAHETANGKTLLLNDLGSWLPVSRQELDAIESKKIGGQLFKKLEEKGFVFSSKGKQQFIKNSREHYRHLFYPISLHIVNPTNRCNHNCLYCYSNSQPVASKQKGLDMDAAAVRKVIDFIWQTPSNQFVIEFQGGEPLANFPAIETMIDYAAKKKPRKQVHWRIVSNLSLMDATIAGFFKKNNVNDICTSLDGPKRLHDKNRPLSKGSSYAQVTYWINALRSEFGFKQIGALCTITKHSLPFATQIVDEYLQQGLPDVTAVSLRPIGRAKQNWGKIGYDAGQFFRFWQQMVEYCISLNRKGQRISEQTAAIMLRKISSPESIFHTCYSKPCGAALMQCSFQPNGDIYSCDEAKALPLFKIGSIGQSYKEVFTSPAALNLVALSSSLSLPCNNCKWTGFCKFCPVTAYAEQGSLVPLLAEHFECNLKQKQFPFLFDKIFSKDRSALMNWVKKAKIG